METQDVQKRPIRIAGDGKAIRFGESYQRVVILLSGTKLRGELLRCQIVTILRIGGVANLFNKMAQCPLVLQGQCNGQVQE